MTAPKRWLESDEAPPELARLLAAGTPPSAIDAPVFNRSHRRVAALAAVPAAAATLVWVHLGLGAALGTAVSLAAVGLSSPPEAPPAPPVVQPKPVPPSPPPSAAPRPVERNEPAPEREPSRAPAVPAPSVEPANEVSPPPRQDTLASELALLERARRLVLTNPAGALSVLSEHERDFGSGALALERELMAVDALMRLGRRSDAEARAARLRAMDPRSLYAERLSDILERRK